VVRVRRVEQVDAEVDRLANGLNRILASDAPVRETAEADPADRSAVGGVAERTGQLLAAGRADSDRCTAATMKLTTASS
jgi:hypothetical protein